MEILCCPEQDVVDGEGGWNLISNGGELVVVETLRQEICFSALALKASKSFSIDRRSRRQTRSLGHMGHKGFPTITLISLCLM